MKLICVGNTVIDVTVAVGEFPAHGGDVLARSGALHAGGSGFNVMSAASRLGLTSVYAGMHGTGPFSDLARTAMAREGILLAHEPHPDSDTGWDIAITDATAERTFITVVGAEARLTAEHLSSVQVHPGDAVYVSGYGLLADPNQTTLRDWLRTIDPGAIVVTDPGPLLAEIPKTVLDAVLERTTWLSLNEREAHLLSGEADPFRSATQLAARVGHHGGGVILRRGGLGCLMAEIGEEVQTVPGIAVQAVDTNGAGDTHVGAFIASLLQGLDPQPSAVRANAAAACSVTGAGPATGPTTRELERFFAAQTVK